ncbi:MAG: fibrillarin-like rRNA/tRNA 2'-O-methyltransferase [Thaumarchaeota archaeon]|nr:fibrillarin-like rRNA/tRNA 2'-O-methyltransferase [Nitrososphaerota archaeon]
MEDKVILADKETKRTTGKSQNEGNLENEEGNIFWVKIDGEKKLATLNLVPGNQVYKEKLVKISDEEFRAWDPFRSKLGAAIMNNLGMLPIVRKSRVLYLGVSTGTTASHVSDIVGPSGIVFCVEHTSRVAREFLDRVASYRANIVPILQDARNPKEYFSVYGGVDVVYVDIAQPDQTEIAILNCKTYLKKDGYMMLVIKTRSIDVTKDPSEITRNEARKLKDNFEIVQELNLEPYEKDHSMIVAKYLG